ncbi:MAG: UDP-N-acetylglucosamine 2-epimerase [Acidimicrobiaceae bacterium]|nr:UDP-N-acetylglucosamine 2-epimerase [Acidimicrobiaceae bacterium]MCY4293405.1 UDP-N-acetylglucosamine 2-epimerase [Acidimicrobiaceae bacterium]
MAPLLRRMDAEQVGYRLIDSGQHGDLTVALRRELGLREPDLRLGGDRDVVSVPQAVAWSLRLSSRVSSRRRLLGEVFGGHGGVCVVHGDTPSTLLSAVLAKRGGLAVAHVEAGLRTFRWLHPFPEELVRVMVGRVSDVLFAPGPEAAENLRSTGVKGRIVEQSANTGLESLRHAMKGAHAAASQARGSGPAVVTMHRVENLHRRSRRQALIDLVADLAARMPLRWVMHGPTERALTAQTRTRLSAVGVEFVPLMAYGEFLSNLEAAPFVISDGGSIQEECALLGVPLLIWRDRSDRSDGLGGNAVLSHYDEAAVKGFVSDPQRFRRAPQELEFSPSAQILAELDEWR